MTNKSESRQSQNQHDFIYTIPDGRASFITQYLVAGITRVVTNILTVVVIFLVLFGGLWLAYTHLSTNVFLIILAVLMADISLGIILRFIHTHR